MPDAVFGAGNSLGVYTEAYAAPASFIIREIN